MTLVRIKNPVEYSFYSWMRSKTDFLFETEEIRFYRFVHNVFTYGASKWKDLDFFKEKILEEKPNFSTKKLSEIVRLYDTLIKFQKIKQIPSPWFLHPDAKAKRGYYIERGFKNGEFYEEEKLVDNFTKNKT